MNVKRESSNVNMKTMNNKKEEMRNQELGIWLPL